MIARIAFFTYTFLFDLFDTLSWNNGRLAVFRNTSGTTHFSGDWVAPKWAITWSGGSENGSWLLQMLWPFTFSRVHLVVFFINHDDASCTGGSPNCQVDGVRCGYVLYTCSFLCQSSNTAVSRNVWRRLQSARWFLSECFLLQPLHDCPRASAMRRCDVNMIGLHGRLGCAQ